MIDKHIDNPKSPKFYIKRYILENKDNIKNKTIIDLPAGSGATSELLHEFECNVLPFDLFPEYFVFDKVKCHRANAAEQIPIDNSMADMIICQEGLEHFQDQLKVLREFNRVLKLNGKLVVTVPSYSNLKSRLSYLLFETEYFNKMMPANELDSIWMADNSITDEIYYGHIFLLGIQKLRLLAYLAGFKIHKTIFTRINKTSLILFPFFYPFILISSVLTYLKAMKKNNDFSKHIKKKVYLEQLKLNINPKILLDSHTFIIFEKEHLLEDIAKMLNTKLKGFNQLT